MKKNKPEPNKYVLLVFALISILLFMYLLMLEKNSFGISLLYSAVAFFVPSFVYAGLSYLYFSIKEANKSDEGHDFLKSFENQCMELKGDTNFPKEVCDILNKYFKDQMSHSVKNPIEGEVWKNKSTSSFP